jgi:ubiquinone/menaquinone biosynthesis C-methylase UbiE
MSVGKGSPVGVAEGYERWAPTYDLFPNPLLACEERHLISLLPNLERKCVLDLACGTGRWLQRLLRENVAFGVGADFSKAMLKVANQKRELVRHLARADYMSFPFRAEAFDFTICSFATSHMGDLSRLAEELARVTKSNGAVFVTDLHSEAFDQGWRTAFRDSGGPAEIDSIARTSAGVTKTFCAAGWECLAQRSWFMDEAEKSIFESAGRLPYFEAACRIPAISFFHFRRVDSLIADESFHE